MLARLLGLKTVSPEEVQRLTQPPAPAVVIDVNGGGSWMRAHVPGAIHLDPATFGESDLPRDRQIPIVFYCSGPLCMKAPSAARRAEKLGYREVRVMPAGISGWVAAGLPTESAAERV